MGNKAKGRTGRPPSQPGERIREWGTINTPIRPSTRRILDGMAKVVGHPSWRLIEKAILSMYESLDPAVRARVDSELGGAPTPPGKTRLLEIPERFGNAAKEFLRLLEHPRTDLEETTRDFLVKTLRVEIGEAKKEGNGKE